VSSGVIVAYFLLLPALWLLLLGLRPLWLLRVSRFLSRFEPKIKQVLKFDRPVRRLLLLSPFHFRPHALDAWVQHYLVDARENFANQQTVAQRKTYVAM